MGFHTKLRAAWDSSQSMLCVGLDPDPARLPASFERVHQASYEFCKAIVDATAHAVCAFKPQFAYFAAQRAEPELERLCHYIRDDISRASCSSSTPSAATSGQLPSSTRREAFDRYEADVVTVNPYLGTDSIEPFLNYSDHGIFVLCRTSNPGGGDFQSLDVRWRAAVCQRRQASRHRMGATIGDCGLVVGATYPDELVRVRRSSATCRCSCPASVPKAATSKRPSPPGATADGFGMVINSSRAILYASSGGRLRRDAAAHQAVDTRDAIRQCHGWRSAGERRRPR